MVTNDDVAFNGKLVEYIESTSTDRLNAIFLYKDKMYRLMGRCDSDNRFHAFWGDDMAECISDNNDYK